MCVKWENKCVGDSNAMWTINPGACRFSSSAVTLVSEEKKHPYMHKCKIMFKDQFLCFFLLRFDIYYQRLFRLLFSRCKSKISFWLHSTFSVKPFQFPKYSLINLLFRLLLYSICEEKKNLEMLMLAVWKWFLFVKPDFQSSTLNVLNLWKLKCRIKWILSFLSVDTVILREPFHRFKPAFVSLKRSVIINPDVFLYLI